MKHMSSLLLAMVLTTHLFSQGIIAPVPQFNILTYTSATDGSLQTVSDHSTGTQLVRVNGCTVPGKPCSTGFTGKSFPSAKTFFPTYPAIEFSITPAVGYTLTAKSITADARRSGKGTKDIRFAYSVDGGTVWDVQESDLSPFKGSCGETSTEQWNFTDFTAAGTVTFRIYGFNAESKSGVLQLLNINVEGSVAAIDADGDKYPFDNDCNDTIAAIHPGATESCNGIDDNCNGIKDEGFNHLYRDLNGDGKGENANDDTLTVCTSLAGYCTELLPPIDIVITDSKVPVNRDLWFWNNGDMNIVNGTQVRDCTTPSFLAITSGLHIQGSVFSEGSSGRLQFYIVGDTLWLGGKGMGYNCTDPTAIDGACNIKWLLNGKNVDFFNAHCRFLKDAGLFQRRGSAVIHNIVAGPLSTYKWEIDRTNAKYFLVGQEENTAQKQNFPGGGKEYVTRSNEVIDSVHKYRPGVICVADAAPIYSKALSNTKWNDEIALNSHADAVDQYFNLNDFPCPGTSFTDDTAHLSYICNVSIPAWLDATAAKFPGKLILITQISPGGTFCPNGGCYQGTFLATTYLPRALHAIMEWNKTHGNIVVMAGFETLKSTFSDKNIGNINYFSYEPLGRLFTEDATMLNIQTSSGLLIQGVKTTSGTVKLEVLNYSGDDKVLPTSATIDGKYTLINWGTDFKQITNGPTSVKPLTASYVPTGNLMQEWSIGNVQITPPAEVKNPEN